MRLTSLTFAACMALAGCGPNGSLEARDAQVLQRFVELRAVCPGDVCVPPSYRRQVVECMRISLREQRPTQADYSDFIGSLDGVQAPTDPPPERAAQAQQNSVVANQLMTVCVLNIVPLAPQQQIVPGAPASTANDVSAAPAPQPAVSPIATVPQNLGNASNTRLPGQAVAAPAARQTTDPCVQARADWAYLQNTDRVAVLRIYRDNLPPACVVQRALAAARLQELSGASAGPQHTPNGVRAPQVQAPDEAVLALPSQHDARPTGGARLIWATRPSPQQLSQLYPRRARQDSVDGGATLDCEVMASLATNCRVVSEHPTGYGFGAAALQASQVLRAGPTRTDGSSAAGIHSRVTVNFEHAPANNALDH